jgi:hypothetical protein
MKRMMILGVLGSFLLLSAGGCCLCDCLSNLCSPRRCAQPACVATPMCVTESPCDPCGGGVPVVAAPACSPCGR